MTNRIRYLKPDFFLDEDVAALPPLIRLFYAGMWTRADREGRLEDRPQRLKVEIMPYEDGFDANEALDILAKPKKISGRPFIARYEVDGRRFIQILSWARHQRPHPNEKASEIPAVPQETPAMYDKGKTRILHKKDKRHTHVDGDGDFNGDCDGEGNGDGDRDRKCERKGKIAPPAPIRGSGRSSETSARPAIINIETFKSLEKEKGRAWTLNYAREHNYPIPEFLLGKEKEQGGK